jgi:hypothetical protein
MAEPAFRTDPPANASNGWAFVRSEPDRHFLAVGDAKAATSYGGLIDLQLVRRSKGVDQSIRKRWVRRPFKRTEGTVTGTDGEAPLEAAAELVRTYSAVVNAITANVLNAQAGFEWLSAQPPNLEEVRRSLNSIADDGKRAGEVIVRLRCLMEKVPTVDGALVP